MPLSLPVIHSSRSAMTGGRICAAGQQLAAVIQALPDGSPPCVIVAHSMGGLVARVAWSVLLAADQTARIGRIITLGTPHQGSYSMVELFTGDDSTFLLIVTLATLVNAALGAIPGPTPPCASVGVFNNLEVVFTFPGFYQLLPLLNSPNQASDPNRLALYTAANWQPHSPTQAWLDNASGPWATLMNSAASMPPAWVLTTVAGNGVPTPNLLNHPGNLGRVSAYGTTSAGDNSVTVDSALVAGSVQYTLPAAHNDIPLAALSAGILIPEILAVRTPITPVPPEEDIPGPVVQSLGGFPYPVPNVLRGSGSGFMAGDC